MNDFTVVQDSREREPWDFTFYGAKQERRGLKTGDYTLNGYEKYVRIERKKTTGELAGNIGKLSKRFNEEMERMKAFPYRYLILEFTEDTIKQFPLESGIPEQYQNIVKISGNYILSSVDKIREKYDIEVVYAINRQGAIDIALDIFNKVVQDNGKKEIIF